MIDKVLILGIRRANQLIPDHEINQMIGRCGRSYTESGEATLIVPEKDFEVANRYLQGKPKPITSSFFEEENITFHVLPAIYHKIVYDEATFNAWYSRSLSYLQGKVVKWNDLQNCLRENNCIIENDGRVSLSEFGEISYRYYFTPERITYLKEKMQIIETGRNQKDPFAISWMLSEKHIAIGDVNTQELSDYKSNAGALGLYFYCGELVEGYAYNCILENRKPKWLKFEIINLKKDLPRLLAAAERICEVENINLIKPLSTWKICIERKFPYELAEMCLEFPEATNQQILELNSLGLHIHEDLKTMYHRIDRYGSESLKEYANIVKTV